MSYRTTPNISKIISGHNSKILKDSDESEQKCNCRNKAACPLENKCQTRNLIYQATVHQTLENKSETYIGLTATSFKDRLANHKTSFKYASKSSSTSLARHIWDLKEKNINYTYSWKLIDRAQPFSPVTGVCNLCTTEKFHIIFNPEAATLNKKEEINNSCLHKDPILLDKT